jgi:hypothetical protein
VCSQDPCRAAGIEPQSAVGFGAGVTERIGLIATDNAGSRNRFVSRTYGWVRLAGPFGGSPADRERQKGLYSGL